MIGTTNAIKNNWVLLWENASPTSEFAAQTILLDLSDYTAIYIDCSTNGGVIVNTAITDRYALSYNNIWNSGYELYARYFTITNEGITFTGANRITAGQSGYKILNAYQKPFSIYGIKRF